MNIYLHNTKPKVNPRLVADLRANGYTLVEERRTAGTPGPSRRRKLRMHAMLESDAVVYGKDVTGSELLRLRAACLWSGLRLVPLEHLPETAPESARELNRLSITEPVVDVAEDGKLGALSIAELQRLQRTTKRELEAIPVVSALYKAKSRWHRAITDRLARVTSSN